MWNRHSHVSVSVRQGNEQCYNEKKNHFDFIVKNIRGRQERERERERERESGAGE